MICFERRDVNRRRIDCVSSGFIVDVDFFSVGDTFTSSYFAI